MILAACLSAACLAKAGRRLSLLGRVSDLITICISVCIPRRNLVDLICVDVGFSTPGLSLFTV